MRDLIMKIGENEEEYLVDESKYKGDATSISFPETKEEILEIIKICKNKNEGITIQGALTGIVGGGVPSKDHIMNMKKMNKILSLNNENILEVEAGTSIDEIESYIRKETNNMYFFPIIPTEKTATIGGMFGSGSNGIQSHYYGELVNYIEEIKLCTANGEIKDIKEEEIKEMFRSEGMFGVIISFKLKLVKKLPHLFGVAFFFDSDEIACTFADEINENEGVLAVEYMDRNTIEIIEQYKSNMSSISELPDISLETKALIYVEVAGESEEKLEEALNNIIEKCMECGGDPDNTWAMSTEEEIESVRAFRHAGSECVNMTIAKNNIEFKEIKKISLDIGWRKKSRYDIIKNYRNIFEENNINYCIFGHIGMKQPYVNIISNTEDEYFKAVEIIKKIIKKAYEEGEILFSEHGVGKLKRHLFLELAPENIITESKMLKNKWDKENLFNLENKI